MRSPSEQMVIMIEITNACQYSCSNCTRFCGNHKKPFFMDFETFKRAVDSMKGFKGVVGIIGGEPLLHPEFSHYIDYLRSNSDFNSSMMIKEGFSPLPKDYIKYAHVKHWAEMAIAKGGSLCLFTSIPKLYHKHNEIINDVFGYQRLNDHSYPSFHQPILISRKDLGIDDENFYKLRDACWIQNTWSSSITPKGAFFCEVAAHLDMLFDGPGGWEIEPGWWEREPKDFKEQLNYCEMCGAALETFSRDANEGIYDVSESIYKKLKKIDSPLLKSNKINLVRTEKNIIDGECVVNLLKREFQPDYDKRLGKSSDYLRPKKLVGIFMGNNGISYYDIIKIIDNNYLEVDELLLYIEVEKIKKEEIIKKYKNVVFLEFEYKIPTIGMLINKIINILSDLEWIVIINQSSDLQKEFNFEIKSRYLNPGGLYIFSNETILINKLASSIAKLGFDRMKKISIIKELIDMWDGKKVFNVLDNLKEINDFDIYKIREYIYISSYENDNELIKELNNTFNYNFNKNILIMQTGMIFHSTSILSLVKKLGYNVYVLTSEQFIPYFKEIVDKKNIFSFSHTHFNFEKLKTYLNELKAMYNFEHVLLPVTIRAKTMKKVDDYHEPIKVAKYINENFSIINIERKIIPICDDLREIIK